MADRKLESWKNYLPEFRLRGVPVLLYHGIYEGGGCPVRGHEAKYWISKDQFRKQLEWIRTNDYSAVLLRDLSRVPAEPTNLSKVVILTFDGGLVSDSHIVFPLLREFGYPGEFFLATSCVGRDGYVNWHQVEAMEREGMSFQSHADTHVALTDLEPARLKSELRESRAQLQAHLDGNPEFLSVPFGRLNSRVTEAAFAAGYRGICTSRNGPSAYGSSMVSRIVIYGSTGTTEFARLIDGNTWSHAARAARSALLSIPRRILPGKRAYVTSELAQEGSK